MPKIHEYIITQEELDACLLEGWKIARERTITHEGREYRHLLIYTPYGCCSSTCRTAVYIPAALITLPISLVGAILGTLVACQGQACADKAERRGGYYFNGTILSTPKSEEDNERDKDRGNLLLYGGLVLCTGSLALNAYLLEALNPCNRVQIGREVKKVNIPSDAAVVTSEPTADETTPLLADGSNPSTQED